MEEINIQRVIEEIQAEVSEKYWEEEPILFDEIPIMENSSLNADRAFDRNLLKGTADEMNRRWEIRACRALLGTRIKVFIKKVLRKLMKFYVEPIAEDISEYNSYTVRSVNSICAYIDEQQQQNQKLNSKIDRLEQEILLLKSKIKKLENT